MHDRCFSLLCSAFLKITLQHCSKYGKNSQWPLKWNLARETYLTSSNQTLSQQMQSRPKIHLRRTTSPRYFQPWTNCSAGLAKLTIAHFHCLLRLQKMWNFCRTAGKCPQELPEYFQNLTVLHQRLKKYKTSFYHLSAVKRFHCPRRTRNCVKIFLWYPQILPNFRLRSQVAQAHYESREQHYPT